MKNLAYGILAGAALSLIAAPGVAAEPSTAQQEAAPEIDGFTLAIEAGRWGVLLDRASDGLEMAPFADVDTEDDYPLQIDASLKRSAARLLALRAEYCGDKIEPDSAACSKLDWPAWVLETPRSDQALDVLAARSEWLGAAIGDVVEAGCEAGRLQTGDELFCSVE